MCIRDRLIELFYRGMPVVRTNGLSGGRSVYGHVINKFSRKGRLLHFLTHGVPLARFARESSAKKVRTNAIVYNTALNVVKEGFHPLKEVSTKVKLFKTLNEKFLFHTIKSFLKIYKQQKTWDVFLSCEINDIENRTYCFTNETIFNITSLVVVNDTCLLYTSPSPRDATLSRMPSSA